MKAHTLSVALAFRLLFLALILTSLPGCLTYHRQDASTQNEYQEIAGAVEEMLLTPYYKAKRSDNEIPPVFWPTAIRKLHPITVYIHWSSVFIAVSRNSKEERGYCVMPFASSNFPTVEHDGWIWEPRGCAPLLWMYRRDLIKNKLGPSEKIFKNSPEFRAVEGKHFVLLKECYVFRYVGENNKYHFVGFVSGTGIGIIGFPNDAKDFVGKRVNDIEILGVLPKGTEFTVVQRRQVTTDDDASLTRFDISPIGALQKKWRILDGVYLTDEQTQEGPFQSEIVGEAPH